MGFTIPTSEPTELTAGDSWQWDRTYSDFPPSDGWSLRYVLAGGAEPSLFSIAAQASADENGHEVRVAPTTTRQYGAGRYDLIGFAENDSARHQVYRGPLVVLPDPTSGEIELSFNERMLAAVEAKIADRLAADISAYTLEQQEVRREELATLHRQRNAYADAVRRERGGGFFQTARVRFGTPA